MTFAEALLKAKEQPDKGIRQTAWPSDMSVFWIGFLTESLSTDVPNCGLYLATPGLATRYHITAADMVAEWETTWR